MHVCVRALCACVPCVRDVRGVRARCVCALGFLLGHLLEASRQLQVLDIRAGGLRLRCEAHRFLYSALLLVLRPLLL